MSNSSPNTAQVRGISSILDAVLAKGYINPEQYNAIKFESVNSSKAPEDILIAQNLVSSTDITKIYAEMQGIEYVAIDELDIPIDTLNKLSVDVARGSLAIVFEESATEFKVAMKDAFDLQKIKFLESLLKKRVKAYYSSREQIMQVIDTKYGAQIGKEVDQALEEVGDDTLLDLGSSFQDNVITEDLDKAPIIKIVNMVMDYGLKNKASDIHIEPREKKISVRFRVRGILSEKLTIPRKLLNPLVSRIKILSDLKIDEHRVPQDGRFQVKSGGNLADVRVSIMPSIYGEKIVMRLLQKSQTVLSLEQVGIRGLSLARLKEALKKTQGIILVTGPTGSGKTQTLASCLKILNTNEVNIVTLEDPVEIRVDGVNQVQVNSEVGLTFASGLRSFLRQDPDIILVGEIRDSETASLSVQAALVGRLVLSTIHTNSAAGAFTRLIDMGIEPFLLISTVNLIIAQRLVRTLCDCSEPYEASDEITGKLHEELDVLNGFNIYDADHNLKLHFDKNTTKVTLHKAKGCPKCNNTGYIGRTGIFEALKMSENVSRLIMDNAPISNVNEQAIKEGMLSMVQDGFIKALEGITTIEEVLRVKNE
jgi:type IV pilus assembly protein PilB